MSRRDPGARSARPSLPLTRCPPDVTHATDRPPGGCDHDDDHRWPGHGRGPPRPAAFDAELRREAAARPHRQHPGGWRRPGSTTSAAASCSRPSPSCRSTTRRAPSGASSRPAPARSPASRRPTRSSSSAPARRRRPGCCSTPSTATGRLRRFVPFDVAEPTLRRAAEAIAADYDGLEVAGVVGDFRQHLPAIPTGGHAAVRAARRHDRQLRAARAPPVPRRADGDDAPRRLAPARHRPRQGPGPARRRL